MDIEKILKEVQKKVKLDDKQVKKIGNIISKEILSGKGDKEKAITSIMKELGMSEKDAKKVYDTVIGVVGNNVKDKILGTLFGKKKK